MNYTNPYIEGVMTYVVRNDNLEFPFNPRQLEVDGSQAQILFSSKVNDVLLSQRLSFLLRDIIESGEVVDAKLLNRIGFSREDAQAIGVSEQGIDKVYVPKDWQAQ